MFKEKIKFNSWKKIKNLNFCPYKSLCHFKNLKIFLILALKLLKSVTQIYKHFQPIFIFHDIIISIWNNLLKGSSTLKTYGKILGLTIL